MADEALVVLDTETAGLDSAACVVELAVISGSRDVLMNQDGFKFRDRVDRRDRSQVGLSWGFDRTQTAVPNRVEIITRLHASAIM
ncbi:hypothetical protein ACH5AI_41000 [Streptomyces collinus]|uniref:hypothetical protein n=1 Tax=Streptomyces collinus TaxID=42684 RepID=UPI0037A8E7A3